MEKSNISVIGFLEWEKRKNTIESIFEKLLANTFLKLTKDVKPLKFYESQVGKTQSKTH